MARREPPEQQAVTFMVEQGVDPYGQLVESGKVLEVAFASASRFQAALCLSYRGSLSRSRGSEREHRQHRGDAVPSSICRRHGRRASPNDCPARKTWKSHDSLITNPSDRRERHISPLEDHAARIRQPRCAADLGCGRGDSDLKCADR
ncbi:hypothetical protein AcW1_005513 [Taiwanofungus camphoratus]|nr:hypothetical protein AcV5_005835 [Antrodia cinnamomea]KAI0956964.1 hypothetical protein AcW1_005513 [Antrodia cinnamomea]